MLNERAKILIGFCCGTCRSPYGEINNQAHHTVTIVRIKGTGWFLAVLVEGIERDPEYDEDITAAQSIRENLSEACELVEQLLTSLN